ncbi:MAG: DUF4886 domain-containing protein [Pseudomonadota bacterium]
MLKLPRLPFSQIAIWIAAFISIAATARPSQAADIDLNRIQDDVSRHGSRAFTVLFIGNSHVLVNNVPGRVAKRLDAVVGPSRKPVTARIAINGARLSDFAGRDIVKTALKRISWDILVLQEATASFLSSSGRKNFHASLNWFMRHKPTTTRVVLYQTWPFQSHHWLYHRPNLTRYERPKSPDQMWTWIRSAYQTAVQRNRVTLAPVGHCWLAAENTSSFYSSDGNHASVAGSNLAAEVLTQAIVRTSALNSTAAPSAAPTDCP